jgi:hypothetical protein
MPYLSIQPAVLVLLLPLIAGAQGNGRLEEVKRLAIGYVESARDGRQFDRAAAKLEEVWEQDQTDVAIAEGLAIAYLNGDDRQYNPAAETKAIALMEKALAAGGRATFLVKHSHEHLRLTGRTITKYCAGKLSVRAGHLIYVGMPVATDPAHSFDLAAAEVQVGEPNRQDGMVQVKFRLEGRTETYSLLPRNGNARDGALIREFIRKSLGIQ